METGNLSHDKNLTIISLNIANLLSKLNSLKIFLNNLKGNKPDIIVVVETHISHSNLSGHSKETLRDLIHGYTFFHEGRRVKRGGGVGSVRERGARVCVVAHTTRRTSTREWG